MKSFTDATYIEAGDMSADITGPSLNTRETRMASFTCIFAGLPDGDLIVQGSNDGGVTWADYASIEVAAAGSIALNYADIGFEYMRINFDFTAGTGTLEVQTGVKRDDWK